MSEQKDADIEQAFREADDGVGIEWDVLDDVCSLFDKDGRVGEHDALRERLYVLVQKHRDAGYARALADVSAALQVTYHEGMSAEAERDTLRKAVGRVLAMGERR